jgi:hypothetical protein
VTSKQQLQHDRLVSTLRRRQDAEAAWIAQVNQNARCSTRPTVASRRRLALLWQRREQADQELARLRWVDYGAIEGSRRKNMPIPPI